MVSATPSVSLEGFPVPVPLPVLPPLSVPLPLPDPLPLPVYLPLDPLSLPVPLPPLFLSSRFLPLIVFLCIALAIIASNDFLIIISRLSFPLEPLLNEKYVFLYFLSALKLDWTPDATRFPSVSIIGFLALSGRGSLPVRRLVRRFLVFRNLIRRKILQGSRLIYLRCHCT